GRIGPEAAELAVPARVQLVGRVDDQELAALYAAADALVFPSDEEGFGLPPLEALACGTPVVAFDTRALAETLADEPGARLVTRGDFAAPVADAEAVAGGHAHPPPRASGGVAR